MPETPQHCCHWFEQMGALLDHSKSWQSPSLHRIIKLFQENMKGNLFSCLLETLNVRTPAAAKSKALCGFQAFPHYWRKLQEGTTPSKDPLDWLVRRWLDRFHVEKTHYVVHHVTFLGQRTTKNVCHRAEIHKHIGQAASTLAQLFVYVWECNNSVLRPRQPCTMCL